MTLDVDAVRDLLDRRVNPGSTHWEGCYVDHVDCALAVLLAEVETLREALSGMVDGHPFVMDGDNGAMVASWFVNQARRALDGEGAT